MGGQQHQFSAPGYGSASKVIVYFDPSNPESAMLDNNGDRVGPALFIGLPALACVTLLAIGGTQGWRWKRRNAKRGEQEWWLSRVPPDSEALVPRFPWAFPVFPGPEAEIIYPLPRSAM